MAKKLLVSLPLEADASQLLGSDPRSVFTEEWKKNLSQPEHKRREE